MNNGDLAIYIQGSITGSGASAPLIFIDDVGSTEFNGVIAVNGSLNNVNSSGAEIEIQNLQATNAVVGVAIDYDGYDASDTWVSGATVLLESTTYTGNTPADHVYLVTPCKGDLDNDEDVDGDDADLYDLSDANYKLAVPGLLGSRVYHSDTNFDDEFTAADDARFDAWSSAVCGCIDEEPTESCLDADFNLNFTVDLTDLAILLSDFDCTGGCDGDVDGDGDTDLTDLALLLAAFDQICCPNGPGLSTQSGTLTLSISAWDTSGYSGGGFEGEDEDFVFDAFIELSDSDDDWTTTGVYATTDNGAVFRLIDDPNDPPVPGSSVPEKYTCFFSVPKGVNASSRFTNPLEGGGIAGACFPVSGTIDYTATELDACWWDIGESNDGPAAVVRIVLDVSGVSGADTSGGLGSVYFSTTGPAGGGDIKVADINVHASHVHKLGTFTILEGEFYVTD